MFTSLRALPKNVWVLALTLALVQGGMPLLVLVSGILSVQLTPNQQLATLPLALSLVGQACAVIPAAMLARHLGRKRTAMLGLVIALTGMLSCSIAAGLHIYSCLLLGSILVGASSAFYQQFRFAAIESLVDASNTGPALSVIMMSGIAAGILGPQTASWGSAWFPQLPAFAPAFLLMAGLLLTGLLVLTQFKNTAILATTDQGPARPLRHIVSQPIFLTALLVSLASYVVMSFLMTSTPISMNVLHGHSINDSKRVIQSHVVAMFLPSLFSGFLLKRFGAAPLLIAGSLLYLLVIAIGFSGHELGHYWWALVLLGVGWNFLFLTGTSLLPLSYRAGERHKTQAVNDFTIFSFQALASLSAGWVLFQFGWKTQLLTCLPIALLCLGIALTYTVSRSR